MENTTPKALPYAAKLVGMDDLKSGYTVKVHELIKDVNAKGEERERVQIFEGLVLAVRGAGSSKSFTIYKKTTDGFGVEKIYPISSPVVSKIEFVKAAQVRRAKLHFMADPKKPFNRQLKEIKITRKA